MSYGKPPLHPPAPRTKVERAVESIETFTNAIITLREKADDDRAHAMRDVVEARAECKDALMDFLAPTLRVVQ